MVFRLEVIGQAQSVENKIKAEMYRKLCSWSKKSRWVRIIGFPVSMASGFLTITTRIALIAESVIKGLANVLGAPLFHHCSLRNGLSQLGVSFPKNMLILPASIFSAIVGLGTKTMFILVAPTKYTNHRLCVHAPEEKEWQRRQEIQEEREVFLNLYDVVRKDENNAQAILSLAQCYAGGKGTEKDVNQAFDYCMFAARLEDPLAMTMIGNCYLHGAGTNCDDQQAFEWLQRAALRGDKSGMAALASLYFKVF